MRRDWEGSSRFGDQEVAVGVAARVVGVMEVRDRRRQPPREGDIIETTPKKER